MQALTDFGAFGLAALLGVAGFVGPEDYSLVAWLAAGLAASAGFIQRSSRAGIGLTAFYLFGCAAYLFGLKLKSGSEPSLCNINDVMNCDAVNLSAASELFGIPVALLGMGIYLGIALASMTKPETTPRFYQINGLVSLFNIVFSIYLGIESARIGAVCVVCLTMYAGHVLMLWGSFRGLHSVGGTLFEALPAAATATSTLILGATFAVVTLLGLSSWSGAKSGVGTTPIAKPAPGALGPRTVAADLFSTPRGRVALGGDEPVLGNPSAPYLILEYADYGCPHCATTANELKQLVTQFPEVQVRFRPFPLSGACNPALERDTGPERCRAAMATKCAQRQGRFWELSNMVFANQTHLADGDLAFMAKEVGLDMAAFEACMSDPSTLAAVQADAVAGAEAGIMGTPTLFLKGTHGDRWVEVNGGVAGVVEGVLAHSSGATMPEPVPPRDF